MKPIDVRTSVKKAIEVAQARFGTNGTPIEIELPNDLPRVSGDERRSRKFLRISSPMPRKRLRIKTRRASRSRAKPIREGKGTSGVVVTVQDNGRGIAPDLKDKIFSPFCTTKARGMGLGLPIVKRTVFDHNGRVDIDSNPHGTSVSVMLPASEN